MQVPFTRTGALGVSLRGSDPRGPVTAPRTRPEHRLHEARGTFQGPNAPSGHQSSHEETVSVANALPRPPYLGLGAPRRRVRRRVSKRNVPGLGGTCEVPGAEPTEGLWVRRDRASLLPECRGFQRGCLPAHVGPVGARGALGGAADTWDFGGSGVVRQACGVTAGVGAPGFLPLQHPGAKRCRSGDSQQRKFIFLHPEGGKSETPRGQAGFSLACGQPPLPCASVS